MMAGSRRVARSRLAGFASGFCVLVGPVGRSVGSGFDQWARSVRCSLGCVCETFVRLGYLRDWNGDWQGQEDLLAAVQKERCHDGILHDLLLGARLDSGLLLGDQGEQ